jgi:hypothetical protein
MCAAKKTAPGNQGIQANSVVADVLAVGSKATAYKRVETGAIPEEFLKAITQLRMALSHTGLPQTDKQLLTGQIDALASGANQSIPERSKVQGVLKTVTDTLKSGGVAIKDIADLCDPIMKIAGLVAIPLHLIGL